MARIIVIRIYKGGSGKTTTAVNLAYGLAAAGRKVLLVDLDPQGDAGKHCGVRTRKLTSSINTLFTKVGAKPADVIMPTSFGFDIIPSNEELGVTDTSMKATQIGLFKPILDAIQDLYDYIVIDTKPARSYLTISALVAAGEVLISMQAEYLAMDGLVDTLKEIQEIQNGLNPNLRIVGILPTMVRNTNLAKAIEEEVGKHYAEMVLPFGIRHSVALGEAAYAGKPGILYDAKCAGSLDYQTLARYIDGKKG